MKYKLSTGDWERADLYQVIAFSEAFGTDTVSLIQFRQPGVTAVPDVRVGTKTVRQITWLTDPSIDAPTVAAALADDVVAWLDEKTA